LYKKDIEKIKKEIAVEKNLILPLPDFEKTQHREKLCFIDGGEGIEELLGGVIYFIRASGLLLKESKHEKFVRDLDIGLLNYDDHTKERVEFLRAIMEFDIAMKCIKEHSPEYVFLDGSLYVNASKREIPCKEFQVYRKKFLRLLKLSKSKGVRLCGVSEDSRSRLLLHYLSSKYNIKFPKFMTDSGVLRILAGNKKFMTSVFIPKSKFEFNNSGEEEKEKKSSKAIYFPTLYIQPTPFSNPLRIDVPSWDEGDNFIDIISLIVKLSKGSKWYGYPTPLYLVHLDAKIEKKQIEWCSKQIIHHITREDEGLYDTILRSKRRSVRPGG
jgi:hypothetical protein